MIDGDDGQGGRMEETVKKLEDQISSLRREVSELRARSGDGAGRKPLARQYKAQPIVPPAEIDELSRTVQQAIDDPKIALAPINKQYVKPVKEILAAFAATGPKAAKKLPDVVQIDLAQVGALVVEPPEDADTGLDWNVNNPASA